MSKIQKFELDVDLTDNNQTTALHALLCAMGGQQLGDIFVIARKDEPEEKTITQMVSSKPAKKPKTAAKSKEPEPEEEEESGDEFTLSDVRKMLGDKIQEGGDEVREKGAAKLKEYGAKNVSTLDPKHYGDFIEYLTEL